MSKINKLGWKAKINLKEGLTKVISELTEDNFLKKEIMNEFILAIIPPRECEAKELKEKTLGTFMVNR